MNGAHYIQIIYSKCALYENKINLYAHYAQEINIVDSMNKLKSRVIQRPIRKLRFMYESK